MEDENKTFGAEQPAAQDAPEPTPTQLPSEAEVTHSGAGPAVGIVIIVIVLILGGLYFWNGRQADDDATTIETTAEEIATAPDASLEMLENQSASDELDVIETDLDTTDLDTIDSELSDIDFELSL
jgi:uncharacterized protein HemX